MQPIFITGIGTGIGKTLIAAIVTEALEATYWKPVQAGFDDGTDTGWVSERISRPEGRLSPEAYRLAMAASPHIAARQEGIVISLDKIVDQFEEIRLEANHRSAIRNGGAGSPGGRDETGGSGTVVRPLIIEGAGGLFVPLNDQEFVLDLIRRLDATVILVSRNYLGSINHSLLTATACRVHGLRVAGWIFNDQYGQYEHEIEKFSGLPSIGSIPFTDHPDKAFVQAQAAIVRPALLQALDLPG
jgi:dethiobiotin synthetase